MAPLNPRPRRRFAACWCLGWCLLLAAGQPNSTAQPSNTTMEFNPVGGSNPPPKRVATNRSTPLRLAHARYHVSLKDAENRGRLVEGSPCIPRKVDLGGHVVHRAMETPAELGNPRDQVLGGETGGPPLWLVQGSPTDSVDFAYCAVPNAGGDRWENLVWEVQGGAVDASRLNRMRQGKSGRLPSVGDLGVEAAEMLLGGCSTFKVAVVGNPATRLLAAWLSGEHSAHRSFRCFAAAMADKLDRDMPASVRPQESMCALSVARYDFVGHVETVKEWLPALLDRLKIPTLPGILAGSEAAEVIAAAAEAEGGTAGDTPAARGGGGHENGYWVHVLEADLDRTFFPAEEAVAAYYTPELLDMVGARYAGDIERFGYGNAMRAMRTAVQGAGGRRKEEDAGPDVCPHHADWQDHKFHSEPRWDVAERAISRHSSRRQREGHDAPPNKSGVAYDEHLKKRDVSDVARNFVRSKMAGTWIPTPIPRPHKKHHDHKKHKKHHHHGHHDHGL